MNKRSKTVIALAIIIVLGSIGLWQQARIELTQLRSPVQTPISSLSQSWSPVQTPTSIYLTPEIEPTAPSEDWPTLTPFPTRELPTPGGQITKPALCILWGVEFDSAIWECKAIDGQEVLVHRVITDCHIMLGTGRMLLSDWSVEHSREVLGDNEYDKSAVMNGEGQLQYINYRKVGFDYGFHITLGKNVDSCIQDTEQVLATCQLDENW